MESAPRFRNTRQGYSDVRKKKSESCPLAHRRFCNFAKVFESWPRKKVTVDSLGGRGDRRKCLLSRETSSCVPTPHLSTHRDRMSVVFSVKNEQRGLLDTCVALWRVAHWVAHSERQGKFRALQSCVECRGCPLTGTTHGNTTLAPQRLHHR